MHAKAYAAKDVISPCVGAGLGPALEIRAIIDANSSNVEPSGRGAEIYGGDRWTENFGAQAGYARMRRLNQRTDSGATPLTVGTRFTPAVRSNTTWHQVPST